MSRRPAEVGEAGLAEDPAKARLPGLCAEHSFHRSAVACAQQILIEEVSGAALDRLGIDAVACWHCETGLQVHTVMLTERVRIPIELRRG